MNNLIIAGDIGGTKTLLQLCLATDMQQQVLHSCRYASSDYADFNLLFAEFMGEIGALLGTGSIRAICLGIAGPVSEHTAKVTNLPWLIDAEVIRRKYAVAHVELINDFTAVGYGIDMLKPEDFEVIQSGQAVEHAPRVVIGAGTGLGEGYLVWQGNEYVPLPSEGGHVDFAPANKVQMEMLAYLQDRYGHVSCERVASGSGMKNIYDFLASRQPPSVALQEEMLRTRDVAATLANFAMQYKDPVAEQALDIFIQSFGAQAGNLALTCLAKGGIYIAGGMAPKLVPRMLQGDFVHALCNKGRFESLMKSLPVKIIKNQQVGLLGAVRLAMITAES